MWERIYAIYDKQARLILKGGSSIPLVIMYPNDAVARREFVEIVANVPQLQRHLDDYCLIHVGSINIETGEVTPAGTQLGLPPAQDALCLVMNARDAAKIDPKQIDITESLHQGQPK